LSTRALPQTSTGGAYSAPPHPPSWFREWGPPQRKEKVEGEGKRNKGKKKEMVGRGETPTMPKSRIGKPIHETLNTIFQLQSIDSAIGFIQIQ